MVVRVFREPCYFAEAVYLLYYFVNEVSYEEEFARICKCYCRKADEGKWASTIFPASSL